MVGLFVAGKPLADWADAEKLFAEAGKTQAVEFRDEAGRVIATTAPPPGRDDDPDWVKAITPEAVAKAREGPFFALEEWRKQAGHP
jgi:hypothetical protein